MGLTMSSTPDEDFKISAIDIMSTNKVATARGSKIQYNYQGESTDGYNLSFKDNSVLTPSKMMFNNNNRNLLVLTPKRDNTLVRVDTETGKTLDEIVLQYHEDVEQPLYTITPQKKFGNLETDDSSVSIVGLSKNSIFSATHDVRTPTKHLLVDEKDRQFLNSGRFTSVSTTRDGHIVAGDTTGNVRLFSTPTKGLKRAKTNLNQLADAVISVDTTSDGEWVIWTTRDYIAVINTQIDEGKSSGYLKSMGTQKPDALILRINEEDLKLHNIDEVNFSGARFDFGPYNSDGNVIEEEIIASTGQFLVRWKLRHVKALYKNRDSGKYIKPIIYKQVGNIVDKTFQYGEKSVVTALEHQISTLNLDQ